MSRSFHARAAPASAPISANRLEALSRNGKEPKRPKKRIARLLFVSPSEILASRVRGLQVLQRRQGFLLESRELLYLDRFRGIFVRVLVARAERRRCGRKQNHLDDFRHFAIMLVTGARVLRAMEEDQFSHDETHDHHGSHAETRASPLARRAHGVHRQRISSGPEAARTNSKLTGW